MSNVIPFPVDRIKRIPPERMSSEDFFLAKDEFINIVVRNVLVTMHHRFQEFGINTVSEQFLKDLIPVSTAIKAAIMRFYGLQSFYHVMVDNMPEKDTKETVDALKTLFTNEPPEDQPPPGGSAMRVKVQEEAA